MESEITWPIQISQMIIILKFFVQVAPALSLKKCPFEADYSWELPYLTDWQAVATFALRLGDWERRLTRAEDDQNHSLA